MCFCLRTNPLHGENEVPNKQVLDGNGWKLYRETPYASVKAS